MLKKLSHIIFLLAVVSTAYGQAIKVTVVDNSSGEKVPFAYIKVISQNDKSSLVNGQTNEDGVTTIMPKEYPCSFEIDALGYEHIKKHIYNSPVGYELTFFITKEFSSLNEVVVTGVSRPTKMKDALSNYRIIGKEQIKAQGAVTLDDVLDNQLNISVGNDQVLGSSLKMQGLKGDKVKILIDGVPMNGREDGNINLSQINLNNVERIEMIQGPMSVVYGTDALGGVINVITKKEHRQFALSVGTYLETYKYNFDASASIKLAERHQVSLSGGRNYFKGWKYIDNAPTFNGQSPQIERSLLFNPKEQYIANLAYTYKANSGFQLTFASDFLKEEVVDKGDIVIWNPSNAIAEDSYYRTTRSTNRLSLQGQLGKKGRWQSRNGYVVYARTRNKYYKDMVNLTEELTKAKGDQDTSTFTDVFTRSSYSNSAGKLEYTVGYDINLQFAKSLKIVGQDKELHDFAAYTNISYPIIKDKLTGQLGLRGAINTTYTPPLMPSINFLYTPKKNLQVRASYAQGFRAPSLKEKYLSFVDANHDIIGNSNLNAETSQHIQLSTSYQVYEEKSDYIQFILTGFFNDVKDGIALARVNPDPTSLEYMYTNQIHQTNAIASLQSDGQWNDFHFQVGYSLRYVFEELGSNDAFTAQEATANLQYAWRKLGLNFNAFYKLTSSQPLVIANIDGTSSFNGTQDAFSMFDVSVSKKILDNKVQIVAGVKNLLDVQTVATRGVAANTGSAHNGGTGGQNMLPRTLFASIRLSLNKY